MSGYLESQLSLVVVAEPLTRALANVRRYLSGAHRLREPDDSVFVVDAHDDDARGFELVDQIRPTTEDIETVVSLGFGIRIRQEVRIGRWSYGTMLFLFPAEDAGLGLEWKIGSAPLDAVYDYDSSLERFDAEAKAGLVQFCAGVADAAGAPGFLLAEDDDRLRPLTLSQLMKELDVRTIKWSLAGVRHTLLSKSELERREKIRDPKRIYATTTGFTVRDLIHPVIY